MWTAGVNPAQIIFVYKITPKVSGVAAVCHVRFSELLCVLLKEKDMTLEKIVDCFIWGGLEVAEKLPFHILRFIGVFIAYAVMLLTSPLWVPLALMVGLLDIWRDLKQCT
ncbi:MAG TPA: hypothetical protein ACFYD4_10055 [Candidatus Wunengus sp. YC61]|uniref:hypothetical protein n=1 Tax=Candidatus Wunengus sp. YC61 TaxID=3367698 RepID=UPI004027D40B